VLVCPVSASSSRQPRVKSPPRHSKPSLYSCRSTACSTKFSTRASTFQYYSTDDQTWFKLAPAVAVLKMAEQLFQWLNSQWSQGDRSEMPGSKELRPQGGLESSVEGMALDRSTADSVRMPGLTLSACQAREHRSEKSSRCCARPACFLKTAGSSFEMDWI
jgi:hypothetical protein